MTRPPRIPGRRERFREQSPQILEIERIMRERVQEGAPNLYVFELPWNTPAGTPLFCFVQAKEAWEMPDRYRKKHLDPMRAQDARDGQLVALNTLALKGTVQIGEGLGSVHAAGFVVDSMFEEIRRNNRAARGHLRRRASAVNHVLDMKGAEEKANASTYDDFAEFYAWAYRESQKFAMAPRVNVTSNL